MLPYFRYCKICIFIRFALAAPRVYSPDQLFIPSSAFPTLSESTVRNIDDHMVNWKVFGLINGVTEHSFVRRVVALWTGLFLAGGIPIGR